MESRFSTTKPVKVLHNKFNSYSNSELDSYSRAVYRLYLDSGETDENLKRNVIEAGEEMTFRGMW